MPALLFEARTEIEYQRTNHALGKPVNLEAMFDLVVEHEAYCKGMVRDAEAQSARLAVENIALSSAIIDAGKVLDKTMSEFTLKILDRLNKIDRHEVVKVLKEGMAELRTMQKHLEQSRS